MTTRCACTVEHPPRLVVVTGGPGAGKSAVLEAVPYELCQHVVVLPEAAGILDRGRFPRHATTSARRALQRAIARLQIEMQRMTIEEGHAALILCDRGTLDGIAYWPGDERDYFSELDTNRDRELARYAAVIQLRSPTAEYGYRSEPHRPESATEAAAIDERITHAWAGHRNHYLVDADVDFLVKLRRTIELIRAEVPACCRTMLAA